MWFLDPEKPLSTCVAESCAGCPVGDELHCHFRFRELAHFMLISAPSFILGGAGIYRISGWMLALWFLLIVAYFGFLEIRVMCSHCPHYAEPGRTLKCWANYGAIKLWRYRPGPMSFTEKSLFLAGLIIIFVYPPAFMLLGGQWFLLIVYVVVVAGYFMTVRMFLCTQCINFACPLNLVEDGTRAQFRERNPTPPERSAYSRFQKFLGVGPTLHGAVLPDIQWVKAATRTHNITSLNGEPRVDLTPFSQTEGE